MRLCLRQDTGVGKPVWVLDRFAIPIWAAKRVRNPPYRKSGIYKPDPKNSLI
jgi:hypothetical protein